MTLPVSFNNIPGSGLVAPLFAFEVNSAGQFSSTSRLLLVGHATASGSATVDTPVVVGSQADADALFGPGSMLREMVRIARQNAPAQEIWALPVAATGTAQTWTVTVGAGAIGTAGTGRLRIQDEEIALSISTTDTTSTIATAIAAAVNAYSNPLTGAQLPVTAAAAAAVVTLTARHAGTIMADLEIYRPPSGNLFTAANLTVATGVAAGGVPVLTTGFAALGDDQYDMIVCPWADATSLAAVSSLLSDVSGRWAYLRQAYGHVFTVNTGATAAQTTLGLSMNDRHITVVPRPTGAPHLPYLWATGFAARVAPWLGDYVTGNVSRNQTDLVVQGLTAPRDRSTWPGYATRNTLVGSGVSSWKGTLEGYVAIDKLVTTSRTGAGGLPDATFRDVQAMLQLTHILRFMRFAIANGCGDKAVADINPGNLGSIVTPKDIKALLVGAYQQLALWGLVENTASFAAQVNVQRDTSNGNRVNILMPIQRVKPLDLIAANAVVYATIPAA